MAIDLIKEIKKRKSARYMGLMIFGKANDGKTAYIDKFMTQNNDKISMLCLDVHQMLKEMADPNIVFELTPKKFIEWCLQYVKEQEEALDAVIVDNFDAVVNLWDDKKKKEFVDRLTGYDLQKSVFSKPFIAVLQEDKVFQDAYQEQENKEFKSIIKYRELISI
jgi:hypothetical protein